MAGDARGGGGAAVSFARDRALERTERPCLEAGRHLVGVGGEPEQVDRASKLGRGGLRVRVARQLLFEASALSWLELSQQVAAEIDVGGPALRQ